MSIGFLQIKCEIIFSETLDKPKNVLGTLVCGTPKRPRLILSPWGVVSIIFTAVAERDLVGCVLVEVVAGFTTSALSVTDVVITLVPHHSEVIAFVKRVFQSALARNRGVGIVRAIPAINRAMNVFFHYFFSFLSAFLFAMHSAHFSWSTLSLQKFLHSKQFIVSIPFL
jgi:hypothetical protein